MKILMVAANAKFIHSSLALRSIQKYCEKYSVHINNLELTINHNENQALKSIYEESPDVIAFSCYIWNMEMIEKLIPIIAKILPDTKIILGGPEVSYNSEKLFEEIPQIDIVIEGEGEETWYELLEHYVDKSRELKQIDGIVYRDSSGDIRRNAPRMPLDLNKIPFVYDDIGKLDNRIIYYEASRGCPFSCQYCLSSIDKGVRFLKLPRVCEDMKIFLDHEVKQVKFVDRTFNANIKYAISIWEFLKKNDNGITNFHFEIAADLMTEEALECLKDARPNLFQFEIGVQSTNPDVLTAIQRKMDFEEVASVVNKIKSFGNIHQHLDLIAGLPKEDMDSFRKSFNDVIEIRPEKLQLGFLKVLKGSGLNRDAGKYGLIYKDIAPYEILYTKVLSYDEMLKLHSIEDMLDKFYNSGRFEYSMEYLFSLYPSPFDAMEDLALYWEECGYHKVKHSKNAHYNILIDFTKARTGANIELMKELARFDLAIHEKLINIPKKLLTVDQGKYKEAIKEFYNNKDNIDKYLPQLSKFTSVQINRMAHIEVFQFDLPSLTRTLDFANVSEEVTAIVFNYHNRDPLTSDADYNTIKF